MRRAAAAIVLAVGICAPASARVTSEYAYSYDQVWRATVRLIAVDFRFPIGERDPDIGYLLFEYRENGRSYAGSVELVREEGADARASIRVVVQVGAMPTYVERMILDRLARKLVDEYGVPPPRRPAPAPAPPPAADDDDDEDPAGDAAPAPPAH